MINRPLILPLAALAFFLTFSMPAAAQVQLNDDPSYAKLSLIDLEVGRAKLEPRKKVEMTGFIETELSGSMVFLYSYGRSKLTSSSSARLFRQIVVTRLDADGLAYILEHCGGRAECPATVRGTVTELGTAIIAEKILFYPPQ
ncbi:hypothetical protein [Bradyrhizobium sp. USDA 3364]